MDTPSWVKHFDNDAGPSLQEEGPRKTSASSEGAKPKEVLKDRTPKRSNHRKYYSADFEDSDASTSGYYGAGRMRTVHSTPVCSISDEENSNKKRRRKRMVEESSGYSTTSLSDFELDSSSRSGGGYLSKSDVTKSGLHKHLGHRDDRSDKLSRSSNQCPNRRESPSHKPHSERRLSNISKNSNLSKTSLSRLDMEHEQKVQRPRSMAGSVGSGVSNRSNTSRDTSRKDALSTLTSSDPFFFVHPEPEPFSRRLRNAIGPCLGLLVMLILAASLGAAIYFAVELKKSHEDEIEMLRASLALKIKNSKYGKDLNNLSEMDFNELSADYCQQMDRFYRRSNFRSTYRGCEVISIKNEHINFTLFFLEKEASKKDIMAVIETGGHKVNESGVAVAVVDKFEIELENAKIKFEHQLTPVGFNKITSPLEEDDVINKESRDKKSKMTSSTSKPVKTTTTTTTMKTTTEKRPTASDLAWYPCAYSDDAFAPHPTDCHKYFQCEHGKSLPRTCSGDLVYSIEATVCVEDNPSIKCPDPENAPPKPPDYDKKQALKRPQVKISPPSGIPEKIVDVSNKNHSFTSSKYPKRPNYSKDPCKDGKQGQLFPHPDNCFRFIQCISGFKGLDRNCADGLVYDPKKMACVFPTGPLTCPDLVPCEGVSRGYFPHPTDCSKYIQCVTGDEVVQTCSPGTVWDPNINSCIFKTADSMCPEGD